jgi:hypothetical protein
MHIYYLRELHFAWLRKAYEWWNNSKRFGSFARNQRWLFLGSYAFRPTFELTLKSASSLLRVLKEVFYLN